MNCPIYILYYSSKSQKLFSVEKGGTLILPIFSEIDIAEKYKNRVCEIHKNHGEEIKLILNLCMDKQQASSIFKALYSEYQFRDYYLNPTDPSDSEMATLPLADLILDLEDNKD